MVEQISRFQRERLIHRAAEAKANSTVLIDHLICKGDDAPICESLSYGSLYHVMRNAVKEFLEIKQQHIALISVFEGLDLLLSLFILLSHLFSATQSHGEELAATP